MIILYAQDDLPSLTEQSVLFSQALKGRGHAVDVSYLPGYSHTAEMEAIGSIDALPTRLTAGWIESLLRLKAYVPVVLR